MAQWHLDELRRALERKGWRVAAELPGDGYKVSATWELRRSGDPRTLFLDLDGLDDMRVLPPAESYGCTVRGTTHSLYFRRRGTSDPVARGRWQTDLAKFVEAASGNVAA
jgi:hypothetical protein